MSILLSQKHDLNAQWLSTVARYVENFSLRFLLSYLKRGRHRGVRNQDDMGTSDAAGSNFGNSSIFGGHQEGVLVVLILRYFFCSTSGNFAVIFKT